MPIKINLRVTPKAKKLLGLQKKDDIFQHHKKSDHDFRCSKEGTIVGYNP